MSSRTWPLGLVILALAPGCAGSKIVVTGQEVYESVWKKTTHELEARARFDLNCEPTQVDFALLKKVHRLPSEVGVAGCGKRGTYVRSILITQQGTFVGPWVINGVIEQPEKGQPPTALTGT